MRTPPAKQRRPVRVYKFTRAKYAIECIESGYLKVTTLDELNDPFELCPAYDNRTGASRHLIELHKRTWRKEMGKNYGIISFSEFSGDPVLWSHYADLHTGVALEFDPSQMPSELLPVTYSKDRVTVDLHLDSTPIEQQREALQRVVRTKYQSWGYESEYRLIVSLSDCVPRHGFYFLPVTALRITAILLGIRCTVSYEYMRRLRRASQIAELRSVPVHVSQMSPYRYSIINDRTCEPPPNFSKQRKGAPNKMPEHDLEKPRFARPLKSGQARRSGTEDDT